MSTTEKKFCNTSAFIHVMEFKRTWICENGVEHLSAHLRMLRI